MNTNEIVKKKSEKTLYLTVLSVVSAFSVVCLHINNCFWIYSEDTYWFSANIIECVFYFAVPVFFMITGATLVGYRDRYSTKEFFKRRIRKTVVPFLAWSMLGLLWNIIGANVAVSDLSIKYIINGTLETSWIGIYWFFPALFCVYLSMPLLSAVRGG